MDNLRYWVALSFLPDIGPILSRRLLDRFGCPEAIFRASRAELLEVEKIGESKVKGIIHFNEWDRVEQEINRIKQSGARILTFTEPSFPEAIKAMPDCPPIIYVMGEFIKEDRYSVAIVGSRTPTSYGVSIAEKISRGLSSAGITIVSGMARGIDTIAHNGALKANGRTIAVLGSGIDVVYPPENKALLNKIATSGAVISEFPTGTKPNQENFPRRNRIISGLSLGVVVIEAALDSGSLITVSHALEQGKEVFAVPGNVTSMRSRGTNELIKRGARLVEGAEDIIEELRPVLKGILRETSRSLPPLSEEEKGIIKFLDLEPKHIDVITRESGIPTPMALSLLLNLELKGVVRQAEGKRFVIE